jgi:hypothetical protein
VLAAQGAAAQLWAAQAAGAHAPFLAFLAFFGFALHLCAEQADAAQQLGEAVAGADAIARPPEMARRAISLLAFDIVYTLSVSEV